MTAYFGWRRRHSVIPAAFATATLLIYDAWFDISLGNTYSLLGIEEPPPSLARMPLFGPVQDTAGDGASDKVSDVR
jgi:hypothetical protein